MGKNYQQYHPELHTYETAKNSFTQGKTAEHPVASDHVAILAEVPYSISNTNSNSILPNPTSNDHITLISWNVMQEDGGGTGYSPQGKGAYEELPNDTLQRRNDIVASLVRFVTQNNNLQLICLQELTTDNLLYTLIADELNKHGFKCGTAKIQKQGWDDTKDEEAMVEKDIIPNRKGCLTFYNTAHLEPCDTVVEESTTYHNKLNGDITKFKVKDSQQVIHVLNVHAFYKETTEDHEKHIDAFLKSDPQAISIVVGDFNCPVAPIDSTPKNIATSSSAPFLNENEIQGAVAIDGCFYRLPGQNEASKQAEIQHLNTATGVAYAGQDIEVDIDQLPELQQKEVGQFRQVINLDPYYQTKRIDGKLTCLEYQAQLRQDLSDPTILVRWAKNLKNEEGVGVAINEKLYTSLALANNPDFQLKVQRKVNRNGLEKNTKPLNYFVYVREEHFGKLLKFFDSIKQQKNNAYSENNIGTGFQADSELTASQNNEIESLYSLLTEKEKAAPNSSAIKAEITQCVETTKTLVEEYKTCLAEIAAIKADTSKTPIQKQIEKQMKVLTFINKAKKFEKAYEQLSLGKQIVVAGCKLLGGFVGVLLGTALGLALGSAFGGGAGSVIPVFGNIAGAVGGGSAGAVLGAVKGLGLGVAAGAAIAAFLIGAGTACKASDAAKHRLFSQERKIAGQLTKALNVELISQKKK